MELASIAFVAKKLIGIFLLPPMLPLLVTGTGLVLIMRRRRAGLWLAWGGIVLSLVLCWPASVAWMLRGLEDQPPITSATLKQAQAIVILAGGRRSSAPEYGGETINRITLERVRYGARLARLSGLPVLVTGGAPTKGTSEAELMRRTLKDDFGITARWVEGAALDTRQNAELSARLLRPAGITRIALVTHAAHMPRSVGEFERTGMTVYPAPTAYLSSQGGDAQAMPALPSASSAYAGFYALHEWIGLLAQRLNRLF
ncbi:YdcF family protein [Niveibacterium sp. 24ML]|uniref:YdcF family protein n=1 Tax=Niveibacterium sp. 24ML TaxID=2985512 RepID=UPI00227045A2|nr:YdcF family protein [Niveibacterium sp. 24ML]MCX9156892.1 YdcF family protein [Niveibacterium sp. 24ML]